MDLFRTVLLGLGGDLYDNYIKKQECDHEDDTMEPIDIGTSLNQANLFRRDTCTDAFGDGWSANTCTPGNTVCC